MSTDRKKTTQTTKQIMTSFKFNSSETVLQQRIVGDSEFALVESFEKFRVLKRQNGNFFTLFISGSKIASEINFDAQIKMAEDFQ